MVPVVLIMAGGAMVVGGPMVMKHGLEQLPDGPVADAARAVIGLLTNGS